MKEIQERRISTNRRRVSQYSEERRKTTQYLPRRENIRTVNITSSRISNVPHGSVHMRWRVIDNHNPWIYQATAMCMRRNHENEIQRIKDARLFNSNENENKHNITTHGNIRIVCMTKFAQSNAPRGAFKWGEGCWSARISNQNPWFNQATAMCMKRNHEKRNS